MLCFTLRDQPQALLVNVLYTTLENGGILRMVINKSDFLIGTLDFISNNDENKCTELLQIHPWQ